MASEHKIFSLLSTPSVSLDELQAFVAEHGRKVVKAKLPMVGVTPLHAAAQNECSAAVAQYLVGLNADVDARDIRGRTPLHFAAQSREVERCTTADIAGINVCVELPSREAITMLCANSFATRTTYLRPTETV